MTILRFDARLVCSASSAGTIRLPRTDLLLAQSAADVSASRWMTACRTVPQLRTCTHACTGQRSIHQRYSHAGTRWDTHSYLRQTCCFCCRIQIRKRCCCRCSRFQPACCSMGDVGALWLHHAGMPGGRAHMPCGPRWRNKQRRRLGGAGGDFAGIDASNVI